MCAANALKGGGEVKSRFVAGGELVTLSSLDAAEPVTACPLNRAGRGRNSMTAGVDTSFDYHSDTPQGKDPDRHSPILRRHHQLLWSKDLPYGGGRFDLTPEPGAYVVHRSELGVFFLASDAITTRLRGNAASNIAKIPAAELPAAPK